MKLLDKLGVEQAAGVSAQGLHTIMDTSDVINSSFGRTVEEKAGVVGKPITKWLVAETH